MCTIEGCSSPVMARGRCSRCYQREYMRKRRAEDPEKFREYQRDWRAKNPNYHREKRAANREAYNERSRRYREANPEKVHATQRRSYLKTRYGIEPEDYDEMLARQGGGCAGCGATEGARNQRYLHVDHCHASGAVRGLLCEDCNLTIGRVNENPETLRRLADYLEMSR